MSTRVILRCLPDDGRWKVTRDDMLVCHYPNQGIAERAIARLGRNEARKGNRATAFLYKRDGTLKTERSYSRVNAPWLGK